MPKDTVRLPFRTLLSILFYLRTGDPLSLSHFVTAPSQREPLVGSHRNKGRSVGRIGAVDLRVDCRWNRCSDPSQALRASSPGGRAKGLVGIGKQSVKFRFMELFIISHCSGGRLCPPSALWAGICPRSIAKFLVIHRRGDLWSPGHCRNTTMTKL